MQDILLVGAGGFVGANARFIFSSFFARRFGTAFPYGTLFINVTGSFILSLFTTLAARSVLADPASIFKASSRPSQTQKSPPPRLKTE